MVRLHLIVSLSVGALISLPVLSSNFEQGLRRKVLECNIASGVFQQVAVYQTEGGYTVRTLNHSGSSAETPLLARQWLSQKIPVTCPHSRAACGFVYRVPERGLWAYQIGGRDYMERGNCH